MHDLSFFDRVYDVVRQIPEGKVCTYGLIAKSIGSPGAARMVGWALNKSALEKEFVPAHRVVNRNGMLSGKLHFTNQNTMKEMLESEGIKLSGDKVDNFEQFLWKPKIEID